MQRVLPLLMAIPAILGFGFVEGLWTNRWTPSTELQSAVASLQNVPLNLGDWEGRTREMNEGQLAAGELSGALSREYTRRGTGTTVSILLVCGKPGPVSRHPPDICYRGNGFQLVAPPVQHAIATTAPAPAAEFWTTDFRKEEPGFAEALRIYWAWSTNGDWQALDRPRFTLASHKVAYKLYVIKHLATRDEPLDRDTTQDFIKLLLPELRKNLFFS